MTNDAHAETSEKVTSVGQWILFLVVSFLAVVANLPAAWLASMGLDGRYLVGALGLVVMLAFFLYARFFFFLIYALIAIGANIPAQWAGALGVDRSILIITLLAMVVLSLLNYKIQLLPSGLEKKPLERTQSNEGVKALLIAVEKGHLRNASKVLLANIDPNGHGEDGQTPLCRAVELGDRAMVEFLLSHGADAGLRNAKGEAPLDIALRGGHPAIASLLKARLLASRS